MDLGSSGAPSVCLPFYSYSLYFIPQLASSKNVNQCIFKCCLSCVIPSSCLWWHFLSFICFHLSQGASYLKLLYMRAMVMQKLHTLFLFFTLFSYSQVIWSLTDGSLFSIFKIPLLPVLY